MSVLESLMMITEKEGLDPLHDRLSEVWTWLGDDLVSLDAATRELTAGWEDGDLAHRASRHLLRRPGKRIRPLCVLLSARLGGRNLDDEVRNIAIACELVHAATLLHDDVIDEGTKRRGKAAARMVYGNSASVLAGDHLLVVALKLVQSTGESALLTSLLDTIGEMVAAEALQLERRGGFEPNRDAYLQVVHGKTASLFGWALSAGTTLGGLGEDTRGSLTRAGTALGLAFQLVDDILDLTGETAETGKMRFIDLREGKLTWPVIVGAESDPRILDLAQGFASGRNGDDEAAELLERLNTCGALDATRTLAQREGNIARTELAKLPESPPRRAMEHVVEAAVTRTS